jgi:hypothetical protein
MRVQPQQSYPTRSRGNGQVPAREIGILECWVFHPWPVPPEIGFVLHDCPRLFVGWASSPDISQGEMALFGAMGPTDSGPPGGKLGLFVQPTDGGQRPEGRAAGEDRPATPGIGFVLPKSSACPINHKSLPIQDLPFTWPPVRIGFVWRNWPPPGCAVPQMSHPAQVWLCLAWSASGWNGGMIE